MDPNVQVVFVCCGELIEMFG